MYKIAYLFVFTFFLILLILYVAREIGNKPNDKQIIEFQKLPYFKNGRFVNYYRHIDGFKNANQEEESRKPSMFRILFGLIKPPKQKVEKVLLTKDSFSAIPDYFSVYWFGHAMVLLEIAHKRILIDPVFGRASPW